MILGKAANKKKKNSSKTNPVSVEWTTEFVVSVEQVHLNSES